MSAPASIVLVHGAWHGGWCWSRVLPAVRAAGVPAYALTLTGLGERAHLLTPEIDLATHAADVTGLVESEELDRVILAAHSYSGIFLGGVAERPGSRVEGLLYLDALVPSRGDSALELYPADVAAALEAGATAAGGWRVPPWPAAGFGIVDPGDQEWVDRRLTDHPWRTFTDTAGAPPPDRVPRTYVACTDRRRESYVRFAEAARKDPAWEYLELTCGHDAMLIVPEAVAEILVRAARDRPRGAAGPRP